MLSVEHTRRQLSQCTTARQKAQLGQFLTSETIATFMASLFPAADGDCRLLDAGAGIGSLSVAFLARWQAGGLPFRRVALEAFEIDTTLHPYWQQMLAPYRHDTDCTLALRGEDFIHAAVAALAGDGGASPFTPYTHAVLNPPYKKIPSHAAHRLALRRVGIETVNLYAAFVALAVAQMAPGGQLVAIIPRSCCSGPYYRPFRDFIRARAALRHIHLFTSRHRAFQDDAVLQEHIIIQLERDGQPGPVTVSTSTDATFTDLAIHAYPDDQIVFPEDPQRCIHVPTSPAHRVLVLSPASRSTLAELGLQVSTGPVVDFRLKAHLRAMPEPGTVPLLYPGHCRAGGITWPVAGAKKPNAIVWNAETEKWLYPKGFYCVVRRFSAKEDKRRIVASVVDPAACGHAPLLGFENHLNLFHEHRHGVPPALAHGLAAFLNTTAVDQHLRRFSGHTQVNATDLRLLPYPRRAVLMALGAWALTHATLTQSMLDDQCAMLTT